LAYSDQLVSGKTIKMFIEDDDDDDDKDDNLISMEAKQCSSAVNLRVCLDAK